MISRMSSKIGNKKCHDEILLNPALCVLLLLYHVVVLNKL